MQYDLKKTNSLENCEKESGAIISYFNAPITTIKPSRVTSIPQIYEEVTTSQDLKEATIFLRELKENRGEKEYRKYKAKFLPTITPSGEFSKRGVNGLLYHSGFICIDIDKLNSADEAEKLKVDLSKDETINPIFIFTSPSGKGIKVFVKVNIDTGSHIDYFNSLRNYFKSVWKIDIDTSCKDYLDKIICPKQDLKLYVTQSWLNYTEANQYHHKHEHPNSVVSGVLYFDSDIKNDKILFSHPTPYTQIVPEIDKEKFNLWNSRTWFFPVETGQLIMENQKPSTTISIALAIYRLGDIFNVQ